MRLILMHKTGSLLSQKKKVVELKGIMHMNKKSTMSMKMNRT